MIKEIRRIYSSLSDNFSLLQFPARVALTGDIKLIEDEKVFFSWVNLSSLAYAKLSSDSKVFSASFVYFSIGHKILQVVVLALIHSIFHLNWTT